MFAYKLFPHVCVQLGDFILLSQQIFLIVNKIPHAKPTKTDNLTDQSLLQFLHNQSINQLINHSLYPFNLSTHPIIQDRVVHGGSVVVFRAFRPEGRRFESHSSHHIGSLSKSFTSSCL